MYKKVVWIYIINQLNKKSFKILAYIVIIFILSSPCSAYSNVHSSYNGSTGLLETPNGRVMNDWSMRGFMSIDKPYTYFGFTSTILPFLEANFHMTKISGKSGFSDSTGYGDYKDKAINIKFLLAKEDKYIPSIVVGAEDIWGTALFTSKYIAFSKKISFFDFTLGYAKGRLGGEDLRKYISTSTNSGSSNNNAINFLKESGYRGGKLFGGVEIYFKPSLTFLAEYSPIDYSLDKVNPFYSGSNYELPTTNINYGLYYKINRHLNIKVSLQGGNRISFGFNYQFGFSRDGIFPHLPDKKWQAKPYKVAEYKTYDDKKLSNKLSNEVAAEAFSNVQTVVNKNKIWSEIDNSRYNLDIQAMGRALSTIDEVAPSNYDTLYITLKKRGVPYKVIRVNRREFDAYENHNVSDNYMQRAIVINRNIGSTYSEFSEDKKLYKTKDYGSKKFNFFIAPALKSYLNAKDNPFTLKLSLQTGFSYDISDGLFIRANIRHPLYNSIKDIPSTDELEENDLAIRSQMLEYFKYNHTQLKSFTMDLVKPTLLNSFTKIEVGYFDLAFAGIDLEWYKPMFDDQFGIGLQYQHVYKRYVDNMVDIYNDKTFNTKFINLYYLLSPQYNVHSTFKIGKFLAGDKGIRVDIARHYKQFTIGFFVTKTNSTDIFTHSQNRGYIDKGIYIKVPLDVFTYNNVKGRASYGISPWTRDVGQFANTTYSLYPILSSENNIQIMKNNIELFRK
jgi:hypothetical protein